MLEIVNSGVQSVSAGDAVDLGNIKIQSNCSAVLNNNNIILRFPGYYKIEVRGSILSESDIKLGLVDISSGLVEQGSELSVQGIPSGNTVYLPFSLGCIVHELPSCASINNIKNIVFNNLGNDSVSISSLNIEVNKVC